MASAFQLEELDGGIALATFDLPGKKVNTFSQAVLGELTELVGRLEQRPELRGLLVRSGKPGQFIAGADLNELGALAFLPQEAIERVLLAGHELFARISRLPFPTVALVDGHCMGGGTEFILALDDRIASDNPRTQIALPEVKIGVIPAWGGTQRLPRLIGVHHAIQMITSGEPVSGRRAVELGLVFDAVPADRLLDEGVRRINDLQETGDWTKSRECRSQPVGLTPDQAFFTFATAEGYIRGKTKGQYPAPLVALQAVREGCALPLDEGLRLERQTALDVFGTPVSANLIAVFFMQQRLERDPGVEDRSVTPRDVNRVGVLGAGLMGAGIAAAHARRALATCLVDVQDEFLEKGLARAREVVESRIRIGRAQPQDVADMLARLSTSTSHRLFADCDVVIEAVPESEKLKTGLYRELAGVLREEAILASNTSTISITRMAEASPQPERFAGMHFFHPVDRMALVEVVRGAKTSDETVATLVALAKRIRKTPIVVNDCAGFLVNRVLFPYMTEALLLLQEGAPMDQIDRAAERFGMPMGPIALHDLVGLDTAWYAGQVLAQAYSDRAVTVALVADLAQAGRLGQKSGAGFRKFGKKGRPQPDPEFGPILEKHRTGNRVFDDAELTDRLFLPMLLEAVRALEEGIVREPADVDMGVILGIGFPPFRGGLLRWCDTEGPADVLQRVERYSVLGKRYEPPELLKQKAQRGEPFYPRPSHG